jgi:hypothetical protein
MGLGPNQTVDAALWHILDVNLFRRFPLTRDEFWHETSSIGSSMKFLFQPYTERPKPTPYATWAFDLLRIAPELRTGLELELLLASTSGTRTGSTLDLLLDLETLVGLLLLHSCTNRSRMHECHVPIILPFLMKRRPRRRLYLELILHNTRANGVSKTKKIKIIWGGMSPCFQLVNMSSGIENLASM